MQDFFLLVGWKAWKQPEAEKSLGMAEFFSTRLFNKTGNTVPGLQPLALQEIFDCQDNCV